jgi:hypothetical protein
MTVELATWWQEVPEEIISPPRAEMLRLVEEMVNAIEVGVPEYARPADERYASIIRQAATQAVAQFRERLSNPATSRRQTAELFRRIGRIEAAEGRTLEPMQSSMRIGARVAWHALYEKATSTGMDLAIFARVGEAIFLHLDEIAAWCAEGYAQAKAEVAGELERRRRRLLDLLLTDPPVSPDAIAELARAADWRLPAKVAAVVLDDRGHQEFPPLPIMPPDVLIDLSRREPCMLVPDPDGPGRIQLIKGGLRDWKAAVGPAVPLHRASSSQRWAIQGLSLARRAILPWDSGVIWCTSYMPQLLIFSDEELLDRFSSATLKPLRELDEVQQDRLAETLLAWLEHWGNAVTTAKTLHVHPQTVRYRLRQLEELFSDDLRDPSKRFALELALHGRQVLRGRFAPRPRSGR